ncbi:MAG: hypothetical protein KIS76_04015 [Pyrinomonadaceae bacterium]|nr:hypothetical protein [Pyrinomonadaceae bacterium]
MLKFLKNISPDAAVHIFGTGEVRSVVVGTVHRLDGSSNEAVIFIAESPRPASAEFKQRLDSVACICGDQKQKGLPFCGKCFCRLPVELRDLLRAKRGAELEAVYDFALASRRRAARRKTR